MLRHKEQNTEVGLLSTAVQQLLWVDRLLEFPRYEQVIHKHPPGYLVTLLVAEYIHFNGTEITSSYFIDSL
jgi:hypothetical protein